MDFFPLLVRLLLSLSYRTACVTESWWNGKQKQKAKTSTSKSRIIIFRINWTLFHCTVDVVVSFFNLFLSFFSFPSVIAISFQINAAENADWIGSFYGYIAIKINGNNWNCNNKKTNKNIRNKKERGTKRNQMKETSFNKRGFRVNLRIRRNIRIYMFLLTCCVLNSLRIHFAHENL